MPHNNYNMLKEQDPTVIISLISTILKNKNKNKKMLQHACRATFAMQQKNQRKQDLLCVASSESAVVKIVINRQHNINSKCGDNRPICMTLQSKSG